MRRLSSRLTGVSSPLLRVAVAAVAAFLVVAPGAAAFATDPTTPPPTSGGGAAAGSGNVGPATAGTAVCTLASSTLTEISGMVQTAAGILVVEGRDTDKVTIFTVDPATCKATSKTYGGSPAPNPRDPEDMAVASDGTIVIADIGDPDLSRPTIAVHRIASGGTTAVTSRMAYPDGKKYTAHAMVLDGDDTPIIFTVVAGTPGATIYKPSKPLVPNTADGVPLAKVGQFTPDKADASAAGAATIVTGAAKSADGTKVVVRTQGFAYEYDVPDKDVVKAITTGTARITPLPSEPDGEAICYTTDNTKFLTLSAKPSGLTDNPKLLSYTPFVPTAAADPGTGGGATKPADTSSGSFLSKLTLPQLTRIVAAVGVVGLVLAIAGIVGIRRARRRRREEEEEYDDYYDEDDDRPQRGRRGGGGAARGRGDGYDEHYAEAGYGQNGYGQEQANGYGQQYAQQPYGGQPGYDQYGGQAAGYDQYGGQAPGYDQYGGQAAGYDQYGGQAAGYDQYGGQQQYGPEQNYGGGYGYEEEFDPMNDPRRR